MSFTQNPFALLADDGDNSGDEQPKVTKSAQADAAQAKGAAAGRNTTAGGAATGGAAKGIDAKPARRTVPGQQQSRPPRQPQANGTDAPAVNTSADAPAFEGERGRDSRGTGFGRGGARGGRGDNKDRRRGTFERRGGVAGVPSQRLDRRSATGRTDSDKVEHQGWGGDDGKRELEAENDGVADAAAEAATPTTAAAPADGAEATEAPAAPEASAEPEKSAEPEDNTLSYEEYLKQQKSASRGVLDTLKVSARQVNEGQDEGQWKDAKLKEKVDDKDPFHLGAGKETATGKPKERKQKTVLETDFTTPGPRQSDRGERGGRGGRGRGEGRGAPRGAGRGRGASGFRGGRGGARTNGTSGINVDDNSAFPSLS